MSEDIDKPEEKSDIQPVSLPNGGFVSRIPPYLLEGKTESEQFILTEVSKMSHFIEWAAPILVSSNFEARKTNGKVKGLLAWKEMFSGWKVLILGLFTVIGALAGIVEVIDFITSHMSK